MSRIYSSSIILNTGASLVGAAVCDLESSPIEAPAIVAIDFSVRAGGVSTFRVGVGRSSNTPVPIASQIFIPENPSDPPCTSGLASAWSTAPALPANFYRTASYVNSVYQYVLWTFPAGLKLAPSSSLVLWNFDTSSRASTIQSSWEIEV